MQVDGNDIIASRWAMEQAVEQARAGKGPTVIEMITYRLSDHTTADDATRYRDDEEVEAAWKREPISRLRAYLESQGAWDEKQEEELQAEAVVRIAEEVEAYQSVGTPPLESMFDYMYGDMPADLARQRERALEELK